MPACARRDRSFIAAFASCALLLVAAGCDKAKEAVSKADKTEISTQHCGPNLPATGEKHKVPDPVRPTFCTGPVMWCSYCEYSAEGAFINNSSRPCGVCLKMDTK